jgi:hypothetical protein
MLGHHALLPATATALMELQAAEPLVLPEANGALELVGEPLLSLLFVLADFWLHHACA